MTQMLSVHGRLESKRHFSLVYGFLPSKTRHLYTQLFEGLNSFGPYEPQSVPFDYESGLHNVSQSVWPSSNIRGCLLHYTQSLCNALQLKDLVPQCNVLESTIRKYLGILGAFPLLPEDRIDFAWRLTHPFMPADMAYLTAIGNVICICIINDILLLFIIKF